MEAILSGFKAAGAVVANYTITTAINSQLKAMDEARSRGDILMISPSKRAMLNGIKDYMQVGCHGTVQKSSIVSEVSTGISSFFLGKDVEVVKQENIKEVQLAKEGKQYADSHYGSIFIGAVVEVAARILFGYLLAFFVDIGSLMAGKEDAFRSLKSNTQTIEDITNDWKLFSYFYS